MKRINFSNVEDLIFRDANLQILLPAYMFNYFEQWRLGQRVSFLKSMAKRATLDLLNALRDEHVEILESYFNERVVIERLNYNIVQNIKIPLSDAANVCNELCAIRDFGYFGTWRDDEFLYITFWR